MNSQTPGSIHTLYRSKNLADPFTDVPTQGHVAWDWSGEGWIEMLYWAASSSEISGWLSAEEYSSRKSQEKARNKAYYDSHPNELRRKIDECRRRRACRQEILCPPYATHGWNA